MTTKEWWRQLPTPIKWAYGYIVFTMVLGITLVLLNSAGVFGS